jgi:two-component system LytT family sensor kinase
LFVPLVENAFKFASFRTVKPGVDIRLRSYNGEVVFAISNYYEKNLANHQNEDSGYGLINLEKRLRLTYPDRHQLEIEKGERQFRVKLTIDTHGD